MSENEVIWKSWFCIMRTRALDPRGHVAAKLFDRRIILTVSRPASRLSKGVLQDITNWGFQQRRVVRKTEGYEVNRP